MKTYKYILLIFLLIFTACSNSDDSATADKNKPLNEQKIYKISLEKIDSSEMLKFADLKSKLILINCWGTWPEPCKEETADLKKIYSEFKNSNFRFISVNFDEKESPDIREFKTKYNLDYPIYSGTREFLAVFPIKDRIPASYLISPKGKIIKEYSGKQNYDIYKKDILDNIK